MTRLLRDEGGAALHEIALCAPFLLLLLVGTIDVGRYMWGGILLGNAARAGVQYGALTPGTAGDNSGMITAVQNDAPQLAIPSANVSPGTYCVCDNNQLGSPSPCPTQTTSTTPCPSSQNDEFVKVTVTSTFQPLLHYPGVPGTITMTRTAIQQVQN